ncbi:hypothetical protein GIS00_24855 [Nakamurella sp. YIM 132087]|uniref:Orn/DAP/Arg decarboxylase 2 N-terminal domain-containing protein n=1 Tax=Nakamurella alba TaxID=2665158 RepID=A0A7K1FSR7_9ACTN|nr:alanine racemase [Nakamurella alba]MTD17168.1 hypothetical protein [Nakamurella alba]
MTGPSGQTVLDGIRTRTDDLGVDGRGTLTVGGRPADELLDTFGSPLSVLVESTLRANLRRFRAAFETQWPEPVTVLYAVKSNNAVAVAAVLAEEGAGADCFGAGELYPALTAGMDPRIVVMNGGNKSADDLARAVATGVGVNVDAEDELDLLEKAWKDAGSGDPVAVKLRLKVLPADWSTFSSDSTGTSGAALQDYLERKKWGFTIPRAAEQITRMLASPAVRLTGFHLHVPRVTQDPTFLAAWSAELGRTVVELHTRTGFWPGVVDVGGGWSRERDPESRSLALNEHPVEEYAAAVCGALRTSLEPAGLPLPQLWVEPGRYVTGNAGVLLGRVGAVRHDAGRRWIATDLSTNLLPRIDINGLVHHVLPASRMTDPATVTASVVGPTCIDSVLGRDRELPELARGDLLAVLDAGMYADSISNQFNALPRPAVVLVGPDQVDIVRRREDPAEVFARDVLPPRLTGAGTAPTSPAEVSDRLSRGMV